MTRELSGGNATRPGITGGTAGDHGVGAIRFLGLAGARVRETILVHNQPRRWTYPGDATSIPIARTLVETWLFEKLPDGTQVQWTPAIDPRAMFYLLPFRQTTTGATWRRALRNLGNEDGASG
jgi:polyketide cyclase/dehydrase/lipid transport protein